MEAFRDQRRARGPHRGMGHMTESIFIRIHQVLSAGAENATDALERVSSTSLMRDAIRQVERALEDAQVELDSVRARRIHAERQQEALRERLSTLQEQARFALGKGRADPRRRRSRANWSSKAKSSG